jgi:exopolysaccharide biosynthesis polyprenyl glycosylphosphotransferase
MLNRKAERLKYIISDLLAAGLSWVSFYVFRKKYLEPLKFDESVDLVFNEKFYAALILIPIFWVNFYYLAGYYKNPFRKSRLSELGKTLVQTFVGVTILFFAFVLDDEIHNYTGYYISYATLFGLHFFFTATPRLVLSSILAHKIHNRIIGFNTLLIGNSVKARELFDEMETAKKSSGFRFIGCIQVNGETSNKFGTDLPVLGKLEDIHQIIRSNNIEEVIIAVESSEHDKMEKILTLLEYENVIIKIIPDMYDILSGQVNMTSIFGTPLIQVNRELMPLWQFTVKRIMDVVASIIALMLLAPLLLILAILVKTSSRGPIFFSQERIGKNGRPFQIFKFRSMFQNAEKNGPQLSSEDDPRITSIGRFMRKTRLDELPQFYNVIIGDMSLVGPRPERQYYIDLITDEAPHYMHLLKVRPGITSWGQVKFGYASSVKEMVRRLHYDLIYIENMSLFLDIKILIYTVLIVLQRRGK